MDKEERMAKRKLKKVAVRERGFEPAFEQAPNQWSEQLVRFFDENDVGMDAVWYGRELDLDDMDYYYFMSGYEVYSLFPDMARDVLSGRTRKMRGLEQFLKSKEALASFGHLYANSGSFR